MEVAIRGAEPRDAEAIAAIYNRGITERQATFQTKEHTAEDFLERIERQQPFLVADHNGEVVAWAAVLPYCDQAPYYAGVGEATMYVAPPARRMGVGSRLLTQLASEAERLGFYKLTGKIFTSNRPSIEMITGLGYREVGVHHRHGQLDGEWKDVLVVELLLGDAAQSHE
jgi:phosphinothricin acetyltransferase